QHYLEAAGYRLENGTQDPAAMRFGTTELTRFLSNSGAYVNADANGNQILLNYRSGKEPFHRVSMTDVLQGEVPEDWIRDRIILIGMTSPTTGDLVNSNAVNGSLFGAIYGVEYHAHAISQILAAVLDRRPLLRTWGDGWEYIWIIGWGILGILLGRFLLSPPKVLLGLALSSLVLVAVGYGLLLLGWWIPLAPALMVLVLNGAGLTAALFYRHQQDLEERIQDRQMVIEQTFDAIHNGPLQTLAKMLQDVHDQQVSRTQLGKELMQLNQELRAVYTAVQQETLAQGNPLHICGDSSLNLQHPLSELLHCVYRATLARDFPCFQTLKIKVVSFEEMDDRPLSIEQKRGLCRFLEEALCNAGKYAKGMTRLEVICKSQQGRSVIYVAENGQGMQRSGHIGRGTQQAKQLARQLGGTFRRVDRSPQGTICELSYPVQRLRFWWR
ncbi:MAG TPA: CHASE2 domain-containing protein, partial [Allocoleopsis sp.]